MSFDENLRMPYPGIGGQIVFILTGEVFDVGSGDGLEWHIPMVRAKDRVGLVSLPLMTCWLGHDQKTERYDLRLLFGGRSAPSSNFASTAITPDTDPLMVQRAFANASG